MRKTNRKARVDPTVHRKFFVCDLRLKQKQKSASFSKSIFCFVQKSEKRKLI
jgi:hypothetical protein